MSLPASADEATVQYLLPVTVLTNFPELQNDYLFLGKGDTVSRSARARVVCHLSQWRVAVGCLPVGARLDFFEPPVLAGFDVTNKNASPNV